MTDVINWDAVVAMMERSKRGNAREGDFDLARRAHAADPARYRDLHRETVMRVHDEMTRRGF